MGHWDSSPLARISLPLKLKISHFCSKQIVATKNKKYPADHLSRVLCYLLDIESDL